MSYVLFQICRYFLDALENNKYGWFWECPNGASKCHYRHALPPGFVLKKDKKKEEKSDTISIEDLVEKQVLYIIFFQKSKYFINTKHSNNLIQQFA